VTVVVPLDTGLARPMWHVGGTADDETPSAPGGVDPNPVRPATQADNCAIAANAAGQPTIEP
jgi:hypothetical protein